MSESKLKVGIIYGGRSGEHEVSVLSANSVINAIDKQKYDIYPIGITREGQWLPGQSPLPLVESKDLQVRKLGENITAAAPLENQRGLILSSLKERVDVVFPVLHGPFGEDGTMQGLLELAGIPYVGGGVLASSVGMDKAVMKAVFEQKKLPIGKYLVYFRKELTNGFERIAQEIEELLGYPCFIKPANLGSSVGISKAHHREELKKSLDLAAAYDRKIVVEALLQGREIECAILGNDEPIASVPGEIIPCTEFYDYEAKYVLNDSKLIIPAELRKDLVEKVQNLAIQAFKAVDCAGLARVDFFVDDLHDRVILNEINTIPGFTRISMYPKLWEASGINYVDLIDRLLQLAIERYDDKLSNRIG